MTPVICLDTNRVFKSVKLAAKVMGLAPINITNCCRGRQQTAGGMQWAYFDADPPAGIKKPQTMCWDCHRSDHWMDDPTPCTWARDGIPVEGWVADPKTVHKNSVSYFVHDCPLFKPNERRKPDKGGKKKK